ncbi:MAG: hypothetical protein P4L22_00580 [Candidatus Babeliales bacterium]|nr:hypothetical protein [Candidatus Babeliales bacterium]
MFLIIFNFLLINIDAQEIKNITLFIHGTHTEWLTKLLPKTLYIPRRLVKISDLNKYSYVKWLTTSISGSNPLIYPLDEFYAFGWSGQLSSHARFLAAQTLYAEIQKLISFYKQLNIKTKITIITHSHGGNIALNLAKIPDDKIIIDKLILLACPVIEETQNLVEHKIFKNVYSIYSRIDMFQVMSIQDLPNFQNKAVFSGRKFPSINALKQFAITINDRPIFHIEFIFWKFPKILPQIVSSIDQLETNGAYNLNVQYKKNKILKVDLDKTS